MKCKHCGREIEKTEIINGWEYTIEDEQFIGNASSLKEMRK